ncbi:MAG TPA: GNAT family N-acetyltransferase [Ktedonobacteraceae bacterium]|nr:GNAT family N-acetyltransferase [Ktedonobacteraceae bacterium]
MTTIRLATEADLPSAYEVFYQNELRDDPQLLFPDIIPAYMHHVLQTGTLFVAEEDGEIIAFAGAITRGNISFLTDLFVLPSLQSSKLGKALLRSVLPQDGLAHCTLSSSDPRALALYIRSGMRPSWPQYALQLSEPALSVWQLEPDMEIIEADASDLALLSWDTRISGRPRPQDLEFWIRDEQGVPLWFRRKGKIVGYGYVRFGAGDYIHPHKCKIGPMGADTPEDATACVLAVIHWAAQRSAEIHIDVPGPHPCLAILLERGFHIKSFDTFVSSASHPFFDAQHYIASGGDLL